MRQQITNPTIIKINVKKIKKLLDAEVNTEPNVERCPFCKLEAVFGKITSSDLTSMKFENCVISINKYTIFLFIFMRKKKFIIFFLKLTFRIPFLIKKNIKMYTHFFEIIKIKKYSLRKAFYVQKNKANENTFELIITYLFYWQNIFKIY